MRSAYNLSHLAHLSGQIGRIQTVSVIPVVAGDSLSARISGILRMAQTRKEIVSECQIDICAFYVKHRHLFGNAAWMEFVRKGIQGDVTDNPFTGIAVGASYRNPFYLGIKTCGATVNPALVQGYNFIYTRYFGVPSTHNNGEFNFTAAYSGSPQGPASNQFYPTNETWANNMRQFGAMAARLPHILNSLSVINNTGASGFDQDLSAADYGVLINDTTPNVGLLDIRDLEAIKSRYSDVQEANYFAQYYDDLLEHRWHAKGVTSDADPKPEMIGRETHFISGRDIDGTDDATLGTFVGKSLDGIKFGFPRKYFPEHGNVWIMMVLRFPLVHTKEQHPLLATATPDATLLLGDPKIWQGQKPIAFDPGKYLSGGSIFTPDINSYVTPYGQEYRYQPNRIHPVFETIPGYPFIQWDSANPYPWLYYTDKEYSETFEVSQTNHWTAHMELDMIRYTNLPGVDNSIFAGA